VPKGGGLAVAAQPFARRRVMMVLSAFIEVVFIADLGWGLVS
jgi:hypothetical protein